MPSKPIEPRIFAALALIAIEPGFVADRRGAGPADPPTVETRRGRFTYMADAALFEVCGSGLRFPVAMEAEYLAAERAYLETVLEHISSAVMTLDGEGMLRTINAIAAGMRNTG